MLHASLEWNSFLQNFSLSTSGPKVQKQWVQKENQKQQERIVDEVSGLDCKNCKENFCFLFWVMGMEITSGTKAEGKQIRLKMGCNCTRMLSIFYS